jgi:hypothetical protein
VGGQWVGQGMAGARDVSMGIKGSKASIMTRVVVLCLGWSEGRLRMWHARTSMGLAGEGTEGHVWWAKDSVEECVLAHLHRWL